MLTALLSVVGTLFVLSWLVGVAETIATEVLWRPVYAFGPLVLRQHLQLSPPLLQPGLTLETENGKFKILSSHECIFRLRWRFFDSNSGLRGVINWDGSAALVRIRLSVGPIVFVGLWLSVWALTGVLFTVAQPGVLGPIMLAVGAAMLMLQLVLVRSELSRMKMAIDEYELAAGRAGAHA